MLAVVSHCSLCITFSWPNLSRKKFMINIHVLFISEKEAQANTRHASFIAWNKGV